MEKNEKRCSKKGSEITSSFQTNDFEKRKKKTISEKRGTFFFSKRSSNLRERKRQILTDDLFEFFQKVSK